MNKYITVIVMSTNLGVLLHNMIVGIFTFENEGQVQVDKSFILLLLRHKNPLSNPSDSSVFYVSVNCVPSRKQKVHLY